MEESIEEVVKEQQYDDSFVNEDYLKSSGLVVDIKKEDSARKFNNPTSIEVVTPVHMEQEHSIPSEVN